MFAGHRLRINTQALNSTSLNLPTGSTTVSYDRFSPSRRMPVVKDKYCQGCAWPPAEVRRWPVQLQQSQSFVTLEAMPQNASFAASFGLLQQVKLRANP